MGIFSRMTDIINSNITSLLDRAEDPQKMIRMIIQEMEETLVEVRSSSARVIADRKTAARRLARIKDEIAEWTDKAMLAIDKGREDLARAALSEKQSTAKEVDTIEHELSELDDHLSSLNDEISQLQTKLDDAKTKQKTMLMRQTSVENRLKVRRQSQRANLDDAFDKFERFERRMDTLEGELESMDVGDNAKTNLKSEIDALKENDQINDELSQLKAKMASK
ncbi:phage shock protein PspA [Marinomonas sp. 42_23_T18]|nr:phage shock protein PspA [Marinomonas sp. 42_23_T18]